MGVGETHVECGQYPHAGCLHEKKLGARQCTRVPAQQAPSSSEGVYGGGPGSLTADSSFFHLSAWTQS